MASRATLSCVCFERSFSCRSAPFRNEKYFWVRCDTFCLAKHRLGMCGESSRLKLPAESQIGKIREAALFQELALPDVSLGTEIRREQRVRRGEMPSA